MQLVTYNGSGGGLNRHRQAPLAEAVTGDEIPAVPWGGTMRRKGWFIIWSAIMMPACHAGAGAGDSPFAAVESPAQGDLKYVHGTGPSDIWAAGVNSQFAHYDGTKWSSISSPSDSYSNGVFAIAPNNAWAIGARTILRWNGSAWSKVDVPFTILTLTGLWASGASDVWFAGTFENPDPTAADGLLHWNGSTWSLVPVDGSDASAQGRLWGTSASDVWLIQSLSNTFQHWNGSRWSRTDAADLLIYVWTAVWGSSPTDIWAIGNAAGNYAVAAHWDGTRWSLPPLSDDMKGCAWEGMWGVSVNDIWAVGAFGTTEHWDGSQWSIHSGPQASAQSLFAAWGDGVGGDLWAVGADGAIARLHR